MKRKEEMEAEKPQGEALVAPQVERAPTMLGEGQDLERALASNPSVTGTSATAGARASDLNNSAIDPDQRKKAEDDLNFVTDRLSNQVRAISLGILAIVWALLVGESKASLEISRVHLLGLAGAAVVGMLLDILHYVFAYVSSRRVYAKILGGGDGLYDPNWAYRLRDWFFKLKIAATMVAAFYLLLVLGGAVIQGSPRPEKTGVSSESTVKGPAGNQERASSTKKLQEQPSTLSPSSLRSAEQVTNKP